jgi:hypothetical protein
MRFLYGLILGLMSAVIGAILYLALAGGEYLLVLSPAYHEMKTQLAVLERADRHREELAKKLEVLEGRFQDLSRRFEHLRSAAEEPPEAPAVPEPGGVPVVPAPRGEAVPDEEPSASP